MFIISHSGLSKLTSISNALSTLTYVSNDLVQNRYNGGGKLLNFGIRQLGGTHINVKNVNSPSDAARKNTTMASLERSLG